VSTKVKVACRVYYGTTKEATDGSATDRTWRPPARTPPITR